MVSRVPARGPECRTIADPPRVFSCLPMLHIVKSRCHTSRRRVAQFEPVRIASFDRLQSNEVSHPGTRVALRCLPRNEPDGRRVAIETFDDQTLGYLPAEVAAWVGPLLDSGRVAFDGRISAIDASDSESGARSRIFYLALTQFEQLAVERYSLSLAVRAIAQIFVGGANWCLGRAAVLYQAFSRTPVPAPGFGLPSSDQSAGPDKSLR